MLKKLENRSSDSYINLPISSRAMKENINLSNMSAKPTHLAKQAKQASTSIGEVNINAMVTPVQALKTLDCHFKKIKMYQELLNEIKRVNQKEEATRRKVYNQHMPKKMDEHSKTQQKKSAASSVRSSHDFQLKSTSVFVDAHAPLTQTFNLAQQAPLPQYMSATQQRGNFTSRLTMSVSNKGSGGSPKYFNTIKQRSPVSNNSDLRTVYPKKEEKRQATVIVVDDLNTLPLQIQDLNTHASVERTDLTPQEDRPLQAGQMTFEQLLAKELQKPDSPYNAQAKTFSMPVQMSESSPMNQVNRDLENIVVEYTDNPFQSFSNISQSPLSHLESLSQRTTMHQPKKSKSKKPFLKRGEGVTIWQSTKVNLLKFAESQQSPQSLRESQSTFRKSFKKSPEQKIFPKADTMTKQRSSKLSTSTTRVLKRNISHHSSLVNSSAMGRSPSLGRGMVTSRDKTIHSVEQSLVKSKQGRTHSGFNVATSMKQSPLAKKDLIVQAAVKSITKRVNLDKIAEEKRLSKQTQMQKLHQEMQKLVKKKSFYEKELQSKVQTHQAAVNQLKTELKKKDNKIKLTSKVMKERISNLEKENNQLKSNKQSPTSLLQSCGYSNKSQSPKLLNLYTKYDYQKERNKVYERLGHHLRGAPKVLIESPEKVSIDRTKNESVASFENMEKLVTEDLLFRKLNLEAKYSLKDQPIFDKYCNQEGTVEIIYGDGTKEFDMTSSGMKKRVYLDGLIILTMRNGDIKVCYPDGRQDYIRDQNISEEECKEMVKAVEDKNYIDGNCTFEAQSEEGNNFEYTDSNRNLAVLIEKFHSYRSSP